VMLLIWHSSSLLTLTRSTVRMLRPQQLRKHAAAVAAQVLLLRKQHLHRQKLQALQLKHLKHLLPMKQLQKTQRTLNRLIIISGTAALRQPFFFCHFETMYL